MSKEIEFVPKEIPRYTARVLGEVERFYKEDKELYKEVFAKSAEKFGKESLAYRAITYKVDLENMCNTNFFFNLILGKSLPKGTRIMTLEDADNFSALDKDFLNGIHAKTNQFVFRNHNIDYAPTKEVISNLENQIKERGHELNSSYAPLIITNPELVADRKSDKAYGLKFEIGEDTSIKRDYRFVSGNDKVELGKENIPLKTIALSLVGFSGISIFGNRVFSNNDFLTKQGDYDKIVVVEENKTPARIIGIDKDNVAQYDLSWKKNF